MKKLLLCLLTIACLFGCLAASVSADPSFKEDEIYVHENDGKGAEYTTEVSQHFDKTGSVDKNDANKLIEIDSDKAKAILMKGQRDQSMIADLKEVCPGFPDTAKNSVTVMGNSFDAYNNNGPVKFYLECDKIVDGVKVGCAHYLGGDKWEFVKAESVDTGIHRAYFTVEHGSPFIAVFYKPLTSTSPDQGTNTGTGSGVTVVDTATK